MVSSSKPARRAKKAATATPQTTPAAVNTPCQVISRPPILAIWGSMPILITSGAKALRISIVHLGGAAAARPLRREGRSLAGALAGQPPPLGAVCRPPRQEQVGHPQRRQDHSAQGDELGHAQAGEDQIVLAQETDAEAQRAVQEDPGPEDHAIALEQPEQHE